MKIIRDIEQGTKEWHDLRRAKVTGTKLGEVMGSPLDQVKLISELIAEEGTEQTKAFRPTPEMERGTAEEEFALRAFMKETGKKVEKVTMIISDEMPWLGVSPDGLILDKKTKKYTEQVEIKNPNSSTMILYKMGALGKSTTLSKKHICGVPVDYWWQVVASFLVNEDLERMHFMVYDARFKDDTHKMFVNTVERNCKEMQDALKEVSLELSIFREEWMNYKDAVLPLNF